MIPMHVRGDHLGEGSDYRCRFGLSNESGANSGANSTETHHVTMHVTSPGTLVDDGTSSPSVLCVSPLGARSHMSITLNGQQWIGGNFTFYEESTLLTLSPNSGPLHGETRVSVRGSAFHASTGTALCHIGGHTATATVVSPSLTRCDTPTLDAVGPRDHIRHDFSVLPDGAQVRDRARYREIARSSREIPLFT